MTIFRLVSRRIAATRCIGASRRSFAVRRVARNVLTVAEAEHLPKTSGRCIAARTMLTSSTEAEQVPKKGAAATRAAWQPREDVDIQRVTQTAMIHELQKTATKSIEACIPWFLNTMPASYFRQVPQDFRMDHIKAISAVKDANMDLHLNLQSHLPDGRTVLTRIRPGTSPGVLMKILSELPWNQTSDESLPLSRVMVFSSKDESMSLNLFVYGEEERRGPMNVEAAAQHILEYAEELQKGTFVDDDRHPKPSPLFETAAITEYLQKCSETYIKALLQVDPRRFLRQIELVNKVSGTEGLEVFVEESDEAGHYWIDIAVANSLPQVALENAAHLLFLHRFDISAAHLDLIDDAENGNVTVLRIMASPIKGESVEDNTFEILRRELKRTKWLDPSTMDLVFDRYPWLGVTRGEIITAFCSLMHPIMSKQNAVAFSKANIFYSVTRERYIPFAAAIADLFLDRFDPRGPLSNEAFAERSKEIREKIDADVEDSMAAELLNKMIDIVGHTLRTNVYLYSRFSLGLRLDPRIMSLEHEGQRELPYGILFAHGRRFNAYHVRFRDIARGGMRLVTPRNAEQYALESATQYDECYGLAYAQQLKNKDIPEGGSKAVNLIDVIGMSELGRNFVMRKSVKAFTDTILDLIVQTDETRERIVDYLGKKEVLYLGPDEQVTPDDINWIVKNAAKRGYDTPQAFMSSKPRSGINHKEYGVTSEGVNVYLDVALRRVLGIDPTSEPFTVKMTGGPDGDVAGNEIKILFREYGDNAKIVGIADHSGCAEDPSGLDQHELLRLVKGSLCICHFDPSKLGSEGKLHRVDTEEGVIARNTMHNRLEADAFIPAGGRPSTVDMGNYRHFLKPDGTPTSPLIVEAANLFLTPLARHALFDEAGVVIVKDSSANKGGVITSSYEICAAMLLTEEEFYENKDAIVNEVLDKLRALARMEADLLFREFKNYPGSLPNVSQLISNAINTATDAITRALDDLAQVDREGLMTLFRDHLPKTISDIAFDRVTDRVPEQYIKNAIASCLASRLVYKEGTKFIEAQPPDRLASIAFEYVKKEKEIAGLKAALEGATMEEEGKKKILDLLDAGGARTALRIF